MEILKTVIFCAFIALLLFLAVQQVRSCEAHGMYGPNFKNATKNINEQKCIESDTVVQFEQKRVVLSFRDCGKSGTINVASNKPIFGLSATKRIMGTDNVIGLDAVGYGYRMDRESDRRTCVVKYHISRQAVTDTILAIIKEH